MPRGDIFCAAKKQSRVKQRLGRTEGKKCRMTRALLNHFGGVGRYKQASEEKWSGRFFL